MKKSLLTTISVLCIVYASPLQAQTCAVPPTCSELGYKQKESDCDGFFMLKCPFDTSAVFCGGESCTYTNTSKPSHCATADSCSKKGEIYYSSACTSCAANFTRNSSGDCICNKSCSGNYRLNSSTCSCECALSSSDCSSGYYLNNCKCTSCENYRKGTTTYESVRTSTPYTDEECDAIIGQNGCGIATSYHCGGQTYYACFTTCIINGVDPI